MFKNIGKNIKITAKCLFIAEIAISVIIAMLYVSEEQPISEIKLVIIGLLIVGVVIVAYLLMILLYGFGRLIETNENISNSMERFLEDKNTKDAVPAKNSINVSQTPRTNAGANYAWPCKACGQMRSTSPCPCCGNE